MNGGPAVQTHFISELRNLQHDIEHVFSFSSGQEQGPVIHPICSDDLIYSVPTDMANKEQQQHSFEKEMPFNLFSPCIVSIGPLSFNPSSSLMGNEIKKEALHKMMKEYTNGTNQTPASLTQLIRWIEEREEEIKECYADRAKISDYLSGSTFAGIMLLDSCFLLQLLDSVNEKRHFDKDEWPCLAAVFDDRHMKAMVIQDIFKIGNQIPLFVVQEVARAFEKSFEFTVAKTLFNICPLLHRYAILKTLFNVCPPDSDRDLVALTHQVGTLCSGEKPHLLSLLHRFMCGSLTREKGDQTVKQGKISDELADSVSQRLGDDLARLWTEAREQLSCCEVDDESANVLSRVAWIFLRTIGTYLLFTTNVLLLIVTFYLLYFILAIVGVIVGVGVLILLWPFFIIACMWPHHRMKQQEASWPWFRVKAEILAHHISIQGCCGNIKGICYTPGDNSSLCLPHTVAGETSRVVLHNMIAMERCSQRVDKKTVCNYAILMAKLLQTPTDVQVLEHSKVLFRMDKDRSWTVRMFQDLQESAAGAELRFSDWTDGCLKTLTQLQEEKLPNLPRWKGIRKSMMFWVKDLGRRYAANPWVALSTAAGAILLLMTGAQVVCLFINCSSSSSRRS